LAADRRGTEHPWAGGRRGRLHRQPAGGPTVGRESAIVQEVAGRTRTAVAGRVTTHRSGHGVATTNGTKSTQPEGDASSPCSSFPSSAGERTRREDPRRPAPADGVGRSASCSARLLRRPAERATEQERPGAPYEGAHDAVCDSCSRRVPEVGSVLASRVRRDGGRGTTKDAKVTKPGWDTQVEQELRIRSETTSRNRSAEERHPAPALVLLRGSVSPCEPVRVRSSLRTGSPVSTRTVRGTCSVRMRKSPHTETRSHGEKKRKRSRQFPGS
jgi:hypothetical protein